MKFTVYRRYSQFRDFRLKLNQTPSSLQLSKKLPSFPKKKLISNHPKLKEQRRIMLEKWLVAVMSFSECHELVLKFLEVPEPVSQLMLERSACRLNFAEKAVAKLLRKMSKLEKNGNSCLREFTAEFFQNYDSPLSSGTIGILLKNLVPLCTDPTVACIAIEILYKLLRIESYRYADSIKQHLFSNVELLKQVGIEQHILNRYQSQTGLVGYSIAEIVKEHFDRNNMDQYFKYFLNFNEEAFEKFCSRQTGVAPARHTVAFTSFLHEWRWLNTENYSGGLKIALRKNDEFFEVKAEIFIDANYKVLADYILKAEKRKQWDGYMDDFRLVNKVNEQRYLVWYCLKKAKKSAVDLSLECHLLESDGHFLLLFHSVNSEEIPSTAGKPRVECAQSYFEIQSLGTKVRRSSSSTDEIDSEQESIGSCLSNRLDLEIEDKTSKLNLFFRMKPEMARYFVDDISEETSVLKESLDNLKKIVESEKLNRIFN